MSRPDWPPQAARHDRLPRHEDERLLSGQGDFTADLRLENVCHAVFVRSAEAHARIERIETEGAAALPGVIAIFTAKDLARDGIPGLPSRVSLERPDGSPAPSTPRPLLSGELVRHVGEPVAMIVASSEAAAAEAAELIEIDFAAQPAVTDCRAALAPSAPPVWPDAPDNIAFLWRHGDAAGVGAAIDRAAHVTRLDYGVTRVAASPMEPRATLAFPGGDGRMVVRSSTQNPVPAP